MAIVQVADAIANAKFKTEETNLHYAFMKHQAPKFARLRLLPYSPPSLAILRQGNLHWKH